MKLKFSEVRILVCVLVLVGLSVTPATSSAIRVKWDSAVNGPGNDWGNAYQTVTGGLNAAKAGDEVWVAGSGAHPYVEGITLKSGVGLYGGFAGEETTLDQRDWRANVTVLDGNSSGNVVTISLSAAATTLLDGFTIRNAGDDHDGVYCYSSILIRNNTISGNGRCGIFCRYGSASITGNTVSGNSVYGIWAFDSSPSITNNAISGNSASGILCLRSTALISNNSISGNSENGITCDTNRGYSPYAPYTTISNNTIFGNTWAGIFCRSMFYPTISNNTISGNTESGVSCLESSAYIMGNIVAFSKIGINNQPGLGYYPVMNNNCVFSPGGVNYSRLSAGTGDISEDPLFASVMTNNYHLQASSPCIDKGLNSAVSPGAVDMDGEPRVIPSAGTVDIGADEFTYTVAEAKAFAPDGHWVYLSTRSPVVTTARFSDRQSYYVERLDRVSGIRCSGSTLLDPGHTGVLQGIMDTLDGERVLTQASIIDGTLGTADVPRSLAMQCRSVGGAACGLQCGMPGGFGLNNIGLLVRIYGKVTEIESPEPPASPTWFKIDDGSRVGVKCLVPSGVTIDPDWRQVFVTGVSSCEKKGSDLYRLIRVRGPNDITPY